MQHKKYKKYGEHTPIEKYINIIEILYCLNASNLLKLSNI